MTISSSRHQFPPAIIRHAVWLYVRFTLTYRDVEDLLAERCLGVSYGTGRRRVLKFGPLYFATAACSRTLSMLPCFTRAVFGRQAESAVQRKPRAIMKWAK
jgi:transposase-like protein